MYNKIQSIHCFVYACFYLVQSALSCFQQCRALEGDSEVGILDHLNSGLLQSNMVCDTFCFFWGFSLFISLCGRPFGFFLWANSSAYHHQDNTVNFASESINSGSFIATLQLLSKGCNILQKHLKYLIIPLKKCSVNISSSDSVVTYNLINMLYASKRSSSRFWSLVARSLTISKILLVKVNTAMVWNDDGAAFNPWASTRVSLSQSQLPFPSGDFISGYWCGRIIASRNFIRQTYISWKPCNRYAVLCSHLVLQSPGNLVLEHAGK